MPLIARAVGGAAVAIVIAIVARRARALSASGAVAASIVGACSVAAGWDWGALLLAFFVSSTALSKLGESHKAARTEATAEKGNTRDARQVVANGGVFALAAVGSLVHPHAWLWALGAGALAAATSDTWATEVGTLLGGTPRSIIGGRAVPAGASGGVTAAGTLAAIAGATFIAAGVALLGWSWRVAGAALAGGIAGSSIDSLLGASCQSRRRCESCAVLTERHIHGCGSATRAVAGWEWLDNDVVNLVSSTAGALLTAIVAA